MTSYDSTIAGSYRGSGPVIECILDEGVTTYAATTYMPDGLTHKTFVFAEPLEEGQVVALSNNSACTYAATEGMPVVEKAVTTESLVIGQIVSTPKLHKFASATDADCDSLAERLAGHYYRTALVEIHIPGKVVKAQIMQDGTNACVPGVMTTLNFNITSAYTSGNRGYYFDSGSANGVGGIPLHYVGTGVNGDTYSALVLLTGLLYAVTGA
jgi:hypothetical protein